MLPPGFEPGSTAFHKPFKKGFREAVMIGRTTLREHHPPDETFIIVILSPSLIVSSIGIGVLSLIAMTVSGFNRIILIKSSIVAIGGISCFLAMFCGSKVTSISIEPIP